MKSISIFCGLLFLATSPLFAESHDDDAKSAVPLKNAVVLIIRHAEKPDSGDSLSPMGEERARCYVDYFKNFSVDSKPLKLDYIFAAADSAGSRRPGLTVAPLSRATGLAVDSRFGSKQFQELADEIRSRPHGQHILICWHHGAIPGLLHALGAEPDRVIPQAKWPENVFGWVIQLRYDETGKMVEIKRINQNLMPDDSEKHE